MEQRPRNRESLYASLARIAASGMQHARNTGVRPSEPQYYRQIPIYQPSAPVYPQPSVQPPATQAYYVPVAPRPPLNPQTQPATERTYRRYLTRHATIEGEYIRDRHRLEQDRIARHSALLQESSERENEIRAQQQTTTHKQRDRRQYDAKVSSRGRMLDRLVEKLRSRSSSRSSSNIEKMPRKEKHVSTSQAQSSAHQKDSNHTKRHQAVTSADQPILRPQTSRPNQPQVSSQALYHPQHYVHYQAQPQTYSSHPVQYAHPNSSTQSVHSSHSVSVSRASSTYSRSQSWPHISQGGITNAAASGGSYLVSSSFSVPQEQIQVRAPNAQPYGQTVVNKH